MIAAVGALNARNDWTGITRLYSNMMTLASYCCGFVVVMVIGLHDRNLIAWVGQIVEGVPMLLLLPCGWQLRSRPN